MQTVDCKGAKLSPKLFITIYTQAKKLAPPRFLTLKLHPDVYQSLFELADVPESIQLGIVPGPMGKQITKINCIKPPLGVSDGCTVVQDSTITADRLVFSIHGIDEISFENIT